MYAHFKGKVDTVLLDRVIIEVGNIGYEIYLPENELAELRDIKDEIKIYTYLQVREDDMKLFGFLSIETLNFFKKLISVSGVGPKVALGIIANISANDMCIAIATDNVVQLKSVPGIGPKMAQKIIFELKDKVLKGQMDNIKGKASQNIPDNKNITEAITALQVLGYSKRQVKDIIDMQKIEGESTEDIIKKVLKEMQKI
ncbi:MAG: Holliday junction branch migration protein RuvA [Clostridia bacterium]